MAALAFLARRWGTDPNVLRRSLTEDQFHAYLKIEVKAQVEDRYVGALSVVVGIGAAFAKSNSKILENYLANLAGEGGQPSTQTLAEKIAGAIPVHMRRES